MILILRALLFAVYAHRNQRRKSDGTAYVHHPIRVARTLWRCGYRDPDVLAAALLHDVVEDTDCGVDSFPRRVQVLVSLCTEVKGPPWLVRKRGLLAACRCDPDAASIKAADLADNLLSTARDGWDCLSVGREEYHWYAMELGKLLPHGRLRSELLYMLMLAESRP